MMIMESLKLVLIFTRSLVAAPSEPGTATAVTLLDSEGVRLGRPSGVPRHGAVSPRLKEGPQP